MSVNFATEKATIGYNPQVVKLSGIKQAIVKTVYGPLGQAIVKGAEQKGLPFLIVDNFQSIPGRRIEAEIDGANALIGNRKLMDEREIALGNLGEASDKLADEGKTPMYGVFNVYRR